VRSPVTEMGQPHCPAGRGTGLCRALLRYRATLAREEREGGEAGLQTSEAQRADGTVPGRKRCHV
ncbi:unnamed protein product, partial [Symbiodinium necroappetens]